MGEPRILVLGAGGFVGAAVRRKLASSGFRVLVQDRRGGGDFRADLTPLESGTQLIRESLPDAVINCAGYGVAMEEREPALAKRINAELPAELVRALAMHPPRSGWVGPRLVHIGSAFEYGSVTGRVAEDTQCHPQSVYAETKLAGTRAVQAACAELGVPGVIIRIATVYGPGERSHRLLPSLLRLRQGGLLDLTEGGQERDFTFVDDVAEGISRLLRSPAPPSLMNLATGTLHTVRQFVETALSTLGIPPERVRFGEVPYRPDEVWQGPIDVARLESTLGWKPSTGLAEGIRRTAEWADRHAAASD